MYWNSSKRLIEELLINTNHDILLTTDNVDFFKGINNDRLTVRNNLSKDLILRYSHKHEFNFNLKYLCFKDLPENYDVIFYIDGDIKNKFWSSNSENRLKEIITNHEFIATRLNCYLNKEVSDFKMKKNPLFSHKISTYNILNWDSSDDLMNSQLPSEHFLIFKNDKNKIKLFSNKWEDFNKQMQNANGGNGCWGDGFEIGISARYAGYKNTFDMSFSEFESVFGFVFNGNKF
jgi:hypothetical protein